MAQYNFGVIGLGVMGQNLALNIESHDFRVAGFDVEDKQRKAAELKWAGKQMTTVASLKDLVEALPSHR